MAVFSGPFDPLLGLQQTLDAFRTSGWLDRRAERRRRLPADQRLPQGRRLPARRRGAGVKKADLDVQVKGRTIRISGAKAVGYPERAGVHRRERLGGRFDRAVALPVEIDAEAVKAECRDGILALLLPRAAQDKPKSIQVN
jgi:HSP20 family protein